MLDLGLVDKALAGDGKDADEARLAAVESATVSDVLLAADTARIGLEQGSTDIRLLTAYSLGVFVEQGPKALASIFDSLRHAVATSWHSLRPEERKERTVDGSLARLFRSMVNHIDVHERMQDGTFKAWSRSDHDSVGGPALRASAALREALADAIESPQSTTPLSELDARVRAHFDRFPAPAKPAPRPAPRPEPEPSSSEDAEEPEDAEDAEEAEGPADDTDEPPPSEDLGDEDPDSQRALSRPAARAAATGDTIAVSPAFAQLLRKIEAVHSLLVRGDTERAAVVADDVRRTLEKFDPKVFFPDVLLPYFQLLSQNVDDIAPHWEAIGSPRWEALAQLYQVSLDAFVEE